MSRNLFEDPRQFVDAIPKSEPEEMIYRYRQQSEWTNEELKELITKHFEFPSPVDSGFETNSDHDITEHIEALWEVLDRKPDKKIRHHSRIPLPFPYTVRGGRFSDITYWDSYFTMLGLKAHKKFDRIEAMMENFKWLIDEYGFIPNGNRSYLLSRSHPPLFSHMVELLAGIKGEAVYQEFLPYLKKEYAYWTEGDRNIEVETGFFLCRYYDAEAKPRPECFKVDFELAKNSTDPIELFRHLRAASESGWDFSSRWCEDPNNLQTIETANIIPVDLNALLMHLELTISRAYASYTDEDQRAMQNQFTFFKRAEIRKRMIHKYHWNPEKSCFSDYNFVTKEISDRVTAAMVVPIFCGAASQEEVFLSAQTIRKDLLREGGLRMSTYSSGQEWDAPFGSAPLQWMAFAGLMRNYQFELADEILRGFMTKVEKVFYETGKIKSKYNVEGARTESIEKEYEGQDGFGWTNGVYMAMRVLVEGRNK